MSDSLFETQVFGDGVLTIPPLPKEDKKMPIDIPENVAGSMMADTAGNIQASNRNSRGVFDAVMGAIAGTVQTNFAEIGAIESRAVSGVMGTPVASPSVQSGSTP